MIERCQIGGNGDGVRGLAREGEEGVGRETGAGAVRTPLVIEKSAVRVDVAEGGRIARAWLG